VFIRNDISKKNCHNKTDNFVQKLTTLVKSRKYYIVPAEGAIGAEGRFA
jgi:hypothetical protein